MPTQDDFQQDEGKSILIVGDSGTHKTAMLGSFPAVHIFDFDRGLSILRNMNANFNYDTFKDAPHGSKVFNPKKGIYQWGKAWPAFITRLNQIGDDVEKGKNTFKTLGFDSLTTLSNICMNYVLAENSRTPTDGPRIQDWGAQISLMETVIDQVTAWTTFYKVFTAHVQRDTNTITQQVEKLPLITGKFAGKVSIYFDEVYFTDTKKDAQGKQTFFLHTQSDATMRQAKTRFGVPDNSPATWDAIKQYLEPKS